MTIKTKIFILIAVVVLLSSTPVAFASNSNSEHSEGKRSEKSEVQFESHENEGHDENENEQFEHSKRSENSFKLKEDENEFEITGEITAFSGTSVTVLGQDLIIDPSKVTGYSQKGIIEVGKVAKVEGVIIDGTKYVKKIMIIGTGQGRFQFKVNGQLVNLTPSPTSTPSVTPSLSPSPSATPSVSPSPTTEPTSTPSSNLSDYNVKVKANGPLDSITQFFEQILAFFQGLI